MNSSLLTGSKDRTSPLAATLRAHSGDVVVADSRDRIAGLAARLPARSVGSYVQLLLAQDGVLSWGAVTERIETLAMLAPLLAPEAVVVMVAEDPADPARDRRVVDALCLLAVAALSAGGDTAVTVSVVHEASPATITRLLPGAAPGGGQGPLADFAADRDYADWRTDVLNLTSTRDVTYLGWLNQEGQPRVGLLRGSVVSPLPVPPDSAAAWGNTGPGAWVLGRALIGEVLGGQDIDDALVELFVKDVIDPLPATSFELSSRELRAWIHRYHPAPSPESVGAFDLLP